MAHTRTPWARRGHTLGKTSVIFAGNEIRDLCIMLPYLPVRGRCASNNEKRRRMRRWLGLDWVGRRGVLGGVGWCEVKVHLYRAGELCKTQILAISVSPLNFPEFGSGIIAELILSDGATVPRIAQTLLSDQSLRVAWHCTETTIRSQNRAQCEIRSSYDRLPLKSSASCHISHLNFLVVKVTMRSRRP